MDRVEGALMTLRPMRTDQADVVIDLGGGATLAPGPRVLTPIFSGAAGEVGVRDLVVEVLDTARPKRPWSAHPASTNRELFIAGLDAALSCGSR
jgi:hypothetical protein